MKTDLDEATIARYRQDGFVHIPDLIDTDEVARLKSAVLEAIATMGRRKVAGDGADLFEGDVQLGKIAQEWEGLPCDLPFRSGDHRSLGIAHMVQCMAEGVPHRASADHACHVVEVLEAIQRESRNGQEVVIASAASRPARFDGLKEREPA